MPFPPMIILHVKEILILICIACGSFTQPSRSLSIFVVAIIKFYEINNFLELYNAHTTNKFNTGKNKNLRSKMPVLTILIIYILDRYYGVNSNLASFIVVSCVRILF